MRLFELSPGMLAHASGAMWLPADSTLVVADLHLGYGLAQRRRGQLGPLADQQTAEKLNSALDELRPAKLVFLGDTVHAPKPGVSERDWIAARFAEWTSRAELLVVRGNHDRAIDIDFAAEIAVCEEWRTEGILAVHGDRDWPEPALGETLVIGHLHPAVGVEDAAGVRQRIPVFLSCPGRLLILPAFSPFAAGLDVWRRMPEPLVQYDPQAIAATGKRVTPIGPLSKLASPASGSRASDFQRQRYR